MLLNFLASEMCASWSKSVNPFKMSPHAVVKVKTTVYSTRVEYGKRNYSVHN